MSAHVILFDSENDLLAACIKQPRSFSRLSEAKKLRMCDGGDLPAFSKPVALRAWPGAGKTSGGSRVHHEIGRYRHFLCLKLRWFGGNHNWLVVWNIWTIYICSLVYWECHHPNWRTPTFFGGVAQPREATSSSIRRFFVTVWLSENAVVSHRFTLSSGLKSPVGQWLWGILPHSYCTWRFVLWIQ